MYYYGDKNIYNIINMTCLVTIKSAYRNTNSKINYHNINTKNMIS